MKSSHDNSGNGDLGPLEGVPITPHGDRRLAHLDNLLSQAGAADRALATRERLDRIVAATSPMMIEGETTHYKLRREAGSGTLAPRSSVMRSTGMRLAAGLALTLSVGAAILASRSQTRSPQEQIASPSTDETAALDMLDSFFAQSSLGDAWTDAEALHTRVSADMNSYWGADDLFHASDTQTGDSL